MANSSSCIMKMAPRYSTIRFDRRKVNGAQARQRLIELLQLQYKTQGLDDSVDPIVDVHPLLYDLLVVKAVGPLDVAPLDIEIYVDEKCASAVMRGADVFACGILGSNCNFDVGSSASVFAVLDGKCLRGWNKPYPDVKLFLGNGILQRSRAELFCNVNQKTLKGVGVFMKQPIWIHPKFDQMIEDWGIAQNLPSVLVGHVLNPQPGERVLDMCAAPGGKSTHLATLMNDQGQVICTDVASKRLKLISTIAEKMNLKSITVYRADARKLLEHSLSNGKSTSFSANSFDKILLDAPCSCLGARPSLKQMSQSHISSFSKLQRTLLKSAIELLKSGGILVYSTCTLLKSENEENVMWLLNNYPCMKLVRQEPLIQNVENDNSDSMHSLLQKFDPRKFCPFHCLSLNCLDESIQTINPAAMDSDIPLTADFDTIGFFIAKFEKL